MDNYTAAPEDDEYDVIIEGDLKNDEVEPCDRFVAQVLSAQQVLQLSCTLFVAGLLENALVVFVLVKYKGLKQVEKIYFLNLAISSLGVLLSLPFWAHTALQGGSVDDALCRVFAGLRSASVFSEALFNTLLMVQRYVVTFHVRCPASKTVPGTVMTSVLMWVVAILVILPECVLYEPQTEFQKYKWCSLSRSYFLPADETFWKHFLTLKMNILVLVFPLFVFLFCYVRMGRLRRFRESSSEFSRLAFAVTAVFLLMWAPYNIALFLSAFKERLSLHDCKSSYKLDTSVQVTEIVAIAHCCVTPLLYVFLDRAFRRYLCSLFPWCKDTSLQPSEGSAPGTPRQDQEYCTEM
ncbi:Chemokine C-C motif receptor-like 2 [Sciurus carolinensis]|uniref:Chemokine C-C motif receptor-like 2 n=1 Tax=Sciurus carolinensis TaxID=30640 RepID=A0AA41MIE8_SCICA|nr:Chemokine C-C motif receptor-like 2 [Sciurus carolinensis]